MFGPIKTAECTHIFGGSEMSAAKAHKRQLTAKM